MALIPTMLLRKLYTNNSLKNTAGGVQFAIKNRLSDAELTELQSVSIAGRQVPRSALTLDLGDGNALAADQISSGKPVAFPLARRCWSTPPSTRCPTASTASRSPSRPS